MDYLELDITVEPILPWREVIISQLAEIGFESFTEEKKGLKAYIPHDSFDEEEFGAVLSQARTMDATIDYEKKFIKHQNWNARWEADFEPVKVGTDLVIKAPFHDIKEDFRYEILIAPQMSFGTGHHDTTYLLCKEMLNMNWEGLKVLDVGTGTGVLAILAQFLGASEVMGTEIDHGSYENAVSNIAKNNASSIALLEADIESVPKVDFDVIIANINKNVLKRHLPFYKEKVKQDGVLMMSGFFASDVDELNENAEKNDFELMEKFVRNEWAVVKYKKK
jgi:ribosomal protein L11 methyltransferase